MMFNAGSKHDPRKIGTFPTITPSQYDRIAGLGADGDTLLREADKKPDWAELARDTVTKSREDEYGHPMINFLRIALRWSNWLGVKVTPADVAWMMVDTKLARENHVHKDDNAIDIIGYTLCYQRMDQWMKDKGYEIGICAFDKMNVQFMQRIYEEALKD